MELAATGATTRVFNTWIPYSYEYFTAHFLHSLRLFGHAERHLE